MIFKDSEDYKVFLQNLKAALTPPPKPEEVKVRVAIENQSFKGIPRLPKNFCESIDLVAFCLMPNHFHLLLKQNEQRSMQEMLQSISTRYTMYFNKKYERSGRLYEGRYKAAKVDSDAYLLHLSRYIHLNPLEITSNIKNWYSSYPNYLGLMNTAWIKPNVIINFFKTSKIPEIKRYQTYKDFVENYKNDSSKILGKLTLE